MSDDPLPISLVLHTVFCSRRAWLEAVGEKSESAQLAVGVAAHERVDNPRLARAKESRAVEVTNSQLGVIGRCDVIQREPGGSVRLLEYKSTPVRRRPEVTDAMRVQLALQRLCLEEMGIVVDSQAIVFTDHHVTREVALGPLDYQSAREFVMRTREICSSPTAPQPLIDDPRCRSCSHLGVCLPDEHRALPHPRVHASDPDGAVLHVTTQGSRASIRTGRVEVVKGQESLASIPLERICGVVCHGNVDISGALIRELCWRGVTIVWCTGRGRVVGWSQSAERPNGMVRVHQHVASSTGRLDLAGEFVAAKIANQATQLRRNGGEAVPLAVQRMRVASRRASEGSSLEEILGYEGEAAANYFLHFLEMLPSQYRAEFAGSWPGRQGKAAVDPLNAALNYGYGLLLADVIRAVVVCGLDPNAGFLHSSGRNKPALALDLMEEFRAPVADSAVLSAIANGSLRTSMFTGLLGASRLTDAARKVVTSSYERRAASVITHPQFGYRVTWRRAMEVQARLVLGCLDGSQPFYRGLRTR